MKKNLAVAYAVKRMGKKMAAGGAVQGSEEKRKQIANGFKGVFAKGGIVKGIRAKMAQGGQIPEELDYLDLNESYPDPDLVEFDTNDPHQPDLMADGGMVEDDDIPMPPEYKDVNGMPIKPAKDGAEHYQQGMRKAFKFAEGGEVMSEGDKKKARIKKVLKEKYGC